VFHYGVPFSLAGIAQSKALYIGQMLSAVTVKPQGQTVVFGVRFTPAGAWAFLRCRQSEITGMIAPLEDINGNPGTELTRRMLEAGSSQERVSVIEHTLHSRVPAHPEALDLLANAIVNGHVSSRDARVQMNAGERQWQRLFQERTGIGPKLLERIGRFRRALVLGHAGQTWAEIATQCEYSDQAHLVRDFKEFTGTSPTRAEPDPFT
jgi:AraC-like DNA-binding protein